MSRSHEGAATGSSAGVPDVTGSLHRVRRNTPLATVLVPARNEEARIEACLRSLRNQSLRDIEIVIADGMSIDATRRLVLQHVAEDDRIRLVDNPKRITPHALNVGLEAARGEYLVRVDAHSTVHRDYVERAVELLRTGPWGGVGGRKVAVADTPTGRAICAALSSRVGVGGSSYHWLQDAQEADHVPFGAYAVSTLRGLGGWDPNLLVNQDFELDFRLRRTGLHLLLDPSLEIHWQVPESIHGLARQYFRYGRGKLQVLRKHPRSAKLRHLAPPLLVLMLTSVPALRARGFRRWWVPAVAYTSLLLAGGTVAARGRSGSGCAVLQIPCALAAMHVCWGVGFLVELLAQLGVGRQLGETAMRDYTRKGAAAYSSDRTGRPGA